LQGEETSVRTAKLVSVNVGLPREVEWQGKTVRTSIFKAPVPGRIRVGTLNLEGDRQSDLSVHGGPDKAVYAYPSEHYGFWRRELGGEDLAWGAFGENLTTEGLSEGEIHIGDRLLAGTAEFTVTQPRLPCFKLTARFRRADMAKRFLHSGRTGFYLAVLKEGEVGAGDEIIVTAAADGGVTVSEVIQLYGSDDAQQDLLRRVSKSPALPESWREYFRKRLWDPDA